MKKLKKNKYKNNNPYFQMGIIFVFFDPDVRPTTTGRV